jgi:hypothetical protein
MGILCENLSVCLLVEGGRAIQKRGWIDIWINAPYNPFIIISKTHVNYSVRRCRKMMHETISLVYYPLRSIGKAIGRDAVLFSYIFVGIHE